MAVEYAYAEVLSPQFAYFKYEYKAPDLFYSIPGFLIVLVQGLFMPRIIRRPSDFVLWLMYVVVVVPISLVPFYAPGLLAPQALVLALGACLTFASVLALTGRGDSKIVPVNVSRAGLFWGFVLLFTVATYSLIFVSFGFDVQLVGLFDVNEVRFGYRDTLSTAGPLLGYMIFNQGNVINTFLVTWAARSHRWVILTAAVLGQVVIYSWTGYKTVAISVPACLLIGFLLRKRSQLPGHRVLQGVSLLALTALILDSIRDLDLVEIVIDRMLITAGNLTAIYLTVYSEREKAVWAYSFLEGVLPDPYGVAPGYYVGATYFNRPTLNANANLFADGYANLGVWGILIEAAFLVLLLIAVNSAARGLAFPLVMGTMLLPAFALSNGSPFSAALSFGFVLSVVLFALAPRELFGAHVHPVVRRAVRGPVEQVSDDVD